MRARQIGAKNVSGPSPPRWVKFKTKKLDSYQEYELNQHYLKTFSRFLINKGVNVIYIQVFSCTGPSSTILGVTKKSTSYEKLRIKNRYLFHWWPFSIKWILKAWSQKLPLFGPSWTIWRGDEKNWPYMKSCTLIRGIFFVHDLFS